MLLTLARSWLPRGLTAPAASPRRALRHVGALALLAFGVLVSGGCREPLVSPYSPSAAPSEVLFLAIVFEDGRSGVIELVMLSRTGLGNPSDPTRTAWPELLGSAAIEHYRVDGFSGFRAIIAVDDMTRVDEALAQIGLADLFTDGLQLTRRRAFAPLHHYWELDATVATLPRSADNLLTQASEPSGFTRYRIRVDLPGHRIEEHNAHYIERGVLTWEIDLSDGEPTRLAARSKSTLFGANR